jgi:hypothetical protein
MDMRGQHQQINANLRGKHADLFQARQRATDTMIQGLFAGDELYVRPLFIGANRNIDTVVRAEAAR